MINSTKFFQWLLIAISTIISIIILVSLYPRLHPLCSTPYEITREAVEKKAREYLPLFLQNPDLTFSSTFVIKKNFIIGGMQEQEQNRFWEISIQSPKGETADIVVTGDAEETRRRSERRDNMMRFSPTGQLISMDIERLLPDSLPPAGPADTSARAIREKAEFLIHNLIGDTIALELVTHSLEIDSVKRVLKYTFREAAAAAPDRYTVHMVRKSVVFFQKEPASPMAGPGQTGFEKFSEIAYDVLESICYLVLIIFVFIYLIRQVRREGIGFKIAIRLTIFLSLLQMAYLLLVLWSAGIAAIISGTLGGTLLFALGIMILYPVSESLSREVWPEKLAVTDQFHRLRFFTAGSSRATFRGLYLGLLSLGAYIAVLYFLNRYAGVALHPGHEMRYSTTTLLPVAAMCLTFITTSFYFEYFFRLFSLSLLKRWFKKGSLVLVAGIVVGLFFPVDFAIHNLLLQLLARAVPALLFVYFFLRFDIFTTVVGFFSFRLLAQAAMYSQSADPYFRNIGTGLLAIFGLLAIIALVTFLTKKDDREEEVDFEPDYLVRQKEKERLTRELDIARSVQMKFLPESSPEIPGYQIAAFCQPAWEVGGDYYDFFEIAGGKKGIVIGDVSNKGISAAFYMTLVKGFLKALACQYHEPAEIMCQTNQLFYHNVERGHFISMIFGVLEPATGKLVFARAGHNPLLFVLGQNAESEWKTPPGVGIGLMDDSRFRPTIREEEIALKPGDMVVFYTDGYSEAMNRKRDEFGEQRLKEVVRQHRGQPPSTIIQRLEEAVKSWEKGQNSMDDRTIVVLKRE